MFYSIIPIMSIEIPGQSQILKTAIYQDEQSARMLKERPSQFSSIKVCIQRGSPWGRTLEQYQTLLGHNHAPGFLDYAKTHLPSDLIIVDSGSATGLALTELRQIFPSSELHAIDIVNVLNFFISDATFPERVKSIFKKAKITFHQESHLKINEIFPKGYDLLLCVAAFYDTCSPWELQQYSLEQFYRGLRQKGIAQVLLYTHQEDLGPLLNGLYNQGVPFSFHQGDVEVYKKNALIYDKGRIAGTLTLGPKM
jgi:hypothetical protein